MTRHVKSALAGAVLTAALFVRWMREARREGERAATAQHRANLKAQACAKGRHLWLAAS